MKTGITIITLLLAVAILAITVNTLSGVRDLQQQNEIILEGMRLEQAMKFIDILTTEQLRHRATTGEWIPIEDILSRSAYTSNYGGWKVQDGHAVNENAGVLSYVYVTIVHEKPYGTMSYTLYSDSALSYH